MTKMLSLRRFAFGIALGAIAAIVVLYTVERGSASPTRAGTGGSVQLRKTALGPVLVDARGRTLYLFEKDRTGTSECDSNCAKFWPPLVTRTTPHAGKGVHQSTLGVTRRHDGRRQVTYAGHPLYTFFGDRKAGQTTGEGLTDFGASWDAVAANGRSVERAARDSAGSDSGYGGYSSGH
jgi:predicted lipoprotein with Yx(FWY)xxD motif